MNSEIIKKILEAAVRAPSGDNVQPWKFFFEVSGNFTLISLYNQRERGR
ncbi:MAG: nitroreductase family protein [Methyloprofundus sp.]|nr:nitroreductase family protein [Methyloprofundus sp.]